jgi:hypothetical protein
MVPPNPNPDAPYVNGNPSAGIKGSIIPAEMVEYTQREIVNIITKGGHVPADTDMYQLTRGVRRALYAWARDTGSVNNVSISVDPPLTAYAQGLELRFQCAADNTGPTSISVNGLPRAWIVRKDGSSLLAGDLRQAGVAIIVYDGANFQLVSGVSGSVNISDGWYNGADWIQDISVVDSSNPLGINLKGTPPIAPAAYMAGLGYNVRVANTNMNTTGTVTLNVGGADSNFLGPKNVYLPNGQPLEARDLVPGIVIRVVYDGTQFTMLSKIHMEIIGTAVTFTVGPNAGADFANIPLAMAWVNRRRFDSDGSLLLNLQGKTGTALVHTYNAYIIVDHPQGTHITIQGAGMNFVPSPGNFSSSVGPGSAAGIQGDANGHMAMLQTAFQSEIHFTSDGLLINHSALNLHNILITGTGSNPSQTAPWYTGLSIGGGSTVSFNTVAVCNFTSTCVGVTSHSLFYGTNLYAVGMGRYVALNYSSALVVSGHLVIADSMVDGIQMSFDSSVHADCPSWPRIYSCLNCGINMWGDCSVNMTYLYIINAWNWAVACVAASAAISFGTVYSGGYGYLASQGARVDCNTSNVQVNYGNDYFCCHGSWMYAPSPQNGGSQFIPGRQVWGNGGAFMDA